jgi:hypothetical protein
MWQQYESFELIEDLNPVIKKGMRGVILEIWEKDTYEVEFVKEDGRNYEFEGQGTFTIKAAMIK